VTLVEMCSHLATERAGMGTLHLTVGASELYPNPKAEGGAMDRPSRERGLKARTRRSGQ
jgi:hypothetical protein